MDRVKQFIRLGDSWMMGMTREDIDMSSSQMLPMDFYFHSKGIDKIDWDNDKFKTLYNEFGNEASRDSISQGGMGNRTVYRLTNKMMQIYPKDTFFVIGFTYPSRLEFYDNDTQTYSWTNPHDPTWEKVLKKENYKYDDYHETNCMIDWIQDLYYELKRNNIPHVFMIHNGLKRQDSEFRLLLELLDIPSVFRTDDKFLLEDWVPEDKTGEHPTWWEYNKIGVDLGNFIEDLYGEL